MSCKFTTWVIKIEHIHLVSETLLQSPTEVAGAILFDNDAMLSSNIIFNSRGKNDSVNIHLDKNHMVSFHTHPAIAYIEAGCVYGHPSGDDIREFVRLSLEGALNHAVFTLEGIYIVQIHPLFVTYMLNLTDTNKQTILSLIFKYFSVFHGKRSFHNVKRNHYTPREFVKECNNLTLTKLNLPEDEFDSSMYPSKLISCVWFIADHVKKCEKNYDKLWTDIKTRSLPTRFDKRKTRIEFPFLMLKNPADRTLKTVLKRVLHCTLKQ